MTLEVRGEFVARVHADGALPLVSASPSYAEKAAAEATAELVALMRKGLEAERIGVMQNWPKPVVTRVPWFRIAELLARIPE